MFITVVIFLDTATAPMYNLTNHCACLIYNNLQSIRYSIVGHVQVAHCSIVVNRNFHHHILYLPHLPFMYTVEYNHSVDYSAMYSKAGRNYMKREEILGTKCRVVALGRAEPQHEKAS